MTNGWNQSPPPLRGRHLAIAIAVILLLWIGLLAVMLYAAASSFSVSGGA